MMQFKFSSPDVAAFVRQHIADGDRLQETVVGKEFIVGTQFVREMMFSRRGQYVDGHKHNFGHHTYFPVGKFLVEELDEDGAVKRAVFKEAGRGCWVYIKAHVIHRITCLSPDGGVGHCTYSHQTPQGEVSLEYGGWEEAYQ